MHVVLPPSARRGIYFTIRKFNRDIFGMDDLIRLGSMSPSAKEFLEICVRLKKNIIVAGGTGTGKTSLLNAVSAAIPSDERIVVIEDSSELRLAQPHTLYLEVQTPDANGRGGVSIRDLFKASLRMRPDRIIVGEVRSGEALDMIQSMISGHAGSLTTVHATTPRDALIRLETLSLMSGIELPVYVARAQVASAINLVVQLSRYSEDGSRKISRIAEACGLDQDNNYQFRDLFVSKITGRTPRGVLMTDLAPVGIVPTFANELADYGLERMIKETAGMWKT